MAKSDNSGSDDGSSCTGSSDGGCATSVSQGGGGQDTTPGVNTFMRFVDDTGTELGTQILFIGSGQTEYTESLNAGIPVAGILCHEGTQQVFYSYPTVCYPNVIGMLLDGDDP